MEDNKRIASEKLKRLIFDGKVPEYIEKKDRLWFYHYPEIIRTFVEDGADVNQDYGALLHEAIERGAPNQVYGLLECDINPNSKLWNKAEKRKQSAFEHCCVRYQSLLLQKRGYPGEIEYRKECMRSIALMLARYGADITIIDCDAQPFMDCFDEWMQQRIKKEALKYEIWKQKEEEIRLGNSLNKLTVCDDELISNSENKVFIVTAKSEETASLMNVSVTVTSQRYNIFKLLETDYVRKE